MILSKYIPAPLIFEVEFVKLQSFMLIIAFYLGDIYIAPDVPGLSRE